MIKETSYSNLFFHSRFEYLYGESIYCYPITIYYREMTSIPTIFIQTSGQSINDQNSPINHSSTLAEIRIVLVHGSSSIVNRGATGTGHHIPIIIQLPTQKELKRCAKKKTTQAPKRKQQRQSKQQQDVWKTNQTDTGSVLTIPYIVQPTSNGNTGNEALVELIQQYESNHRSTTTTDFISTTNTAVQMPSIVAVTPNTNEPISDDQFWNEVQDDIDQILSPYSQEGSNETMNRPAPSVHTDIFDDLFL